jgi:ATP-dependent protease ClpP protease subunit
VTKEILLYQPIYSWTAEDFLKQLNDASGSDISVRMNCPGGDVNACYGMIAKFNEHKNGKKIQVDGSAKSMGFYMCCAADNVECLNVSEFLAHRAAYGSWIENDPDRFTVDMQTSLKSTNADLRRLIESKVSAEKFKKITGVSLDDMFSMDGRVDVRFNAQQAYDMGLVQKINPITSEKKAQIIDLAAQHGVAAFAIEPSKIAVEDPQPTNTNTNKNKAMTAAEFKAAHPAEYDKIYAEGAKAENDRVQAWQAFKDIDPDAVAKAIADPKEQVTTAVQSQMLVKAIAKGMVADAQDGNPPVVKTTTPVAQPTAQEANAATFLANCKKELGLAE